MSKIRGANTKPELAVRRIAHALGYRFRLHRRDLPGRPDLVFPSRSIVIFVHGCFWHRHKDCKYSYQPKSNIEFWQQKFQNNQDRDGRVRHALEQMGWRVVVIWECETADENRLREKIKVSLEK